MKKILLIVSLFLGTIFLAGCVQKPTIETDITPRLEAIEQRLDELEQTIEKWSVDIKKSNRNAEIVNENMEGLYKEVDELRDKMGMPLSKPRRELVK